MTHFEGMLPVWNLLMIFYNYNLMAHMISDLLRSRRAKELEALDRGPITDRQLEELKDMYGQNVVVGEWRKRFAYRTVKMAAPEDDNYYFFGFKKLIHARFIMLKTYYEREIFVDNDYYKQIGFQRAETFFDVLKK